MAIHPSFPNLSAKVEVDGQALQEFDDNDTDVGRDRHTVTKYVQVENDCAFAVRIRVPKGVTGNCGVRATLQIDGTKVSKQTIPRAQLLKRDATRVFKQKSGDVDGAHYTQEFRFSSLQIDEEDVDVNGQNDQRLKRIGTISVSLNFVDSMTTHRLPLRKSNPPEARPLNPERQPKEILPSLGVLSEKSLKGDSKSHQASLGTPIFRGREETAQTTNRYKLGDVFAVFCFKYRSIAALKALHVIPDTPSFVTNMPAPVPYGAVELDHGNAMKQDGEAPIPTVQPESDVKQECTRGNKREADPHMADDEVMFVSSKRLKKLPTHRHEIIVLD
ncbi:hypothetical protein ACEQ8H_001486 [Pleosporales sp. CAS-2024a]